MSRVVCRAVRVVRPSTNSPFDASLPGTGSAKTLGRAARVCAAPGKVGLQPLMQELGKHPRKARIALVGHEPNIGELAARLIGSRSPIEFKKGAICRIDFDVLPPKSPGMLRWFLPPRILKQAR